MHRGLREETLSLIVQIHLQASVWQTPISAVVKGAYSASAVGAVALRCIFNSPELGLAVFCMLQSEYSQLQAMNISLQAQGLWNTEHTVSLGDKETSNLQRYVLVFPGQSVAVLFAGSGNTFSWGFLGRGMILKIEDRLNCCWRSGDTPQGSTWCGMEIYYCKRFCPSPAWEWKIQHSGGLLLCHIPFSAPWITHGS